MDKDTKFKAVAKVAIAIAIDKINLKDLLTVQTYEDIENLSDAQIDTLSYKADCISIANPNNYLLVRGICLAADCGILQVYPAPFGQVHYTINVSREATKLPDVVLYYLRDGNIQLNVYKVGDYYFIRSTCNDDLVAMCSAFEENTDLHDGCLLKGLFLTQEVLRKLAYLCVLSTPAGYVLSAGNEHAVPDVILQPDTKHFFKCCYSIQNDKSDCTLKYLEGFDVFLYDTICYYIGTAYAKHGLLTEPETKPLFATVQRIWDSSTAYESFTRYSSKGKRYKSAMGIAEFIPLNTLRTMLVCVSTKDFTSLWFSVSPYQGLNFCTAGKEEKTAIDIVLKSLDTLRPEVDAARLALTESISNAGVEKAIRIIVENMSPEEVKNLANKINASIK